PNSVRGFPRNELGPRVYVAAIDTIIGVDTTYKPDTSAAPTGGNTVFVANAELRFATPLFPQRMRVALFVDAGQVWGREPKALARRSLRVTPRIGRRFTPPLGAGRRRAHGVPPRRGRARRSRRHARLAAHRPRGERRADLRPRLDARRPAAARRAGLQPARLRGRADRPERRHPRAPVHQSRAAQER